MVKGNCIGALKEDKVGSGYKKRGIDDDGKKDMRQDKEHVVDFQKGEKEKT